MRYTVGDVVNLNQAPQEGLQQIQRERVLRIALRHAGPLVYFEEDTVDARRHPRRCHWLDELRLAGGDAVTGSGQLQAVRDVVHTG